MVLLWKVCLLYTSGIELRNSLDVIELDMNEPSLDDTMPDNERLTRALKKYMNLKQVRIPYAVLRKLPDVLRENHFKVKCVVRTAPNDLFVYDIFGKDVYKRQTLYSIMQDPMTSCGCFECICGIEPFSNGVVIANREYAGMTPLGMTFSEMASMTGGGVQTPGFMGHGKHFIASKKFMKAEGGIERIVWMPKELKEFIADRLNATAKELYGIDNFTDMIGDETVATDPETLVGFLTEKGHPALGLDPMM